MGSTQRLFGVSVTAQEARALAPFVLVALHTKTSAARLSTMLLKKAVKDLKLQIGAPTLVMMPFDREGGDGVIRDEEDATGVEHPDGLAVLREGLAEEPAEALDGRRPDHVVEEQLADREAVEHLPGLHGPADLPRHDLLDHRLSHAFAPPTRRPRRRCRVSETSGGGEGNARTR